MEKTQKTKSAFIDTWKEALTTPTNRYLVIIVGFIILVALSQYYFSKQATPPKPAVLRVPTSETQPNVNPKYQVTVDTPYNEEFFKSFKQQNAKGEITAYYQGTVTEYADENGAYKITIKSPENTIFDLVYPHSFNRKVQSTRKLNELSVGENILIQEAFDLAKEEYKDAVTKIHIYRN